MSLGNIIVNESGSASNIENYKIVILGDQQVGKTSLLYKYKYESFEEGYSPTVGIDFLTKNVFLEDKTIRLIMWDTAGQERFKSLIPSYLKNTHAIILTFDITMRSSFTSLSKWLQDIKDHIQDNVYIIVAGNKIDLANKRQISQEEAEKFCTENALSYVETSATNGEGIKKLFDLITSSLCDMPIDMNPKDKTVVLDPQADKEEIKTKKGCCIGKKKKQET